MKILDNLFNHFTDTIFLKEDSSLEKQIEELKEIRETKEDKTLIDRDIKLLELGLIGENEIAYELKNANLGLYVLRDITIEQDEMKAQIDFVVVSKGYIYLIECKNLIGNIWVDSNGQFHREYEFKNKKIKEAIYSPYTQAMRHMDILKKRWLSKQNKLTRLLYDKNFDTLWYKPLVVMANSKGILNTKYAPKEVKEHTIRIDQLVNYIKKDLEKYEESSLASQKGMLEVATSLQNANTNTYHSIADKYKEDDLEEQEKIKKDIGTRIENTTLLNMLKEFRKQKSQSMNIPAYYVFTDKELESIIEKTPKTEQELKEVLPPIKVKVHGEEILQIINREKQDKRE